VRWWSPDALLRDLAEPQGLWLDPQVSWRSFLDNVVRTSFSRRPPDVPPASPVDAHPPVRWWPDPGRFVVDTPRVQAILGHTTRPVIVRSGEPATDPGSLRAVVSQFASVSLASLDGEPLDATRRALLTVAGRTDRDGTLRSNGGPGLLVLGKGPARAEALTGYVDVRWGRRPVVHALDERGESGAIIPVIPLSDGWWRITLDGLTSPWSEWVDPREKPRRGRARPPPSP
jgi:hypothetical protein